ncbi:NADH dehydrogenase subunit 11 (mitochondrion) [Saprolegnia parasitica CBS 223.65]|uniref:NADH dehydrogenase subunit 11 n=1 Tax=Saprolegnia parasitica (strain CBS 223.65) TaxID=695850 RepID=A0A067BMX1_SAPPC|nr:NADH dehydrogenase subunit 11 [Saprolegnia parasitica CBS 223.65]KDO15671.1 NADH dehydrogenase subunit 11 [Saprolegnia parasitica CBS 223.65]|eukprot:XP_012213601.1 NADH dehydrogenase subunit 11 (mitochondrion) [Saprolegnia parasitica CBS 223.65]
MIPIIINGVKMHVKKNITVLQACNSLNIQIPKFCFQENLKIAGNCRMCLVEIKNSPKPVASCAMPVMPNMEIFTNTPLVQKARESVLEFILINHPLDCPICDQASECDLQDQTLIFGSDKSRFFFNKKRSVEDKNIGPFIKTIMTRCIHCTRCVRFADEICRNDHFGTTGRGNSTEINFYDRNIFYSEFSGNLIDLCPVGALTSKPYAFKARSWELTKKEGIDILDAIGSNLNIDTLKNNIVRILPKTNVNINKEWINNKTRFFFDSLKYQRITKPLIKTSEGFKEISWEKVFETINNEVSKRDPSQIQGIVGNLTDIESQFILKKNLTQLGINNISYLYANKKENIFNSDLCSNFLFNSSLKNIENSDLCLILNSDIRSEGSILNIHLINRFQKGNFKIASIGPKYDYTYPVDNLGLNINTLLQIIEGKHTFCKELKKAKNPTIIIGSNFFYQYKEAAFILNKFKNLSFLNGKNFNILQTQTSYLNFLEIFNKKYNFENIKTNLFYLYNTDFYKNLKDDNKNNYYIYQGHHFNIDAQKSNLILPGLTFLEKEGLYINTEGLIQKNNTILKVKSLQKSDNNIFKFLYIFLKKKNQKDNKKNLFLEFNNVYSYLYKSKLHIVNLYKKNTIKIKQIKKYKMFNLKKKLYIENILENHSKILTQSKVILKKKTNIF